MLGFTLSQPCSISVPDSFIFSHVLTMLGSIRIITYWWPYCKVIHKILAPSLKMTFGPFLKLDIFVRQVSHKMGFYFILKFSFYFDVACVILMCCKSSQEHPVDVAVKRQKASQLNQWLAYKKCALIFCSINSKYWHTVQVIIFFQSQCKAIVRSR